MATMTDWGRSDECESAATLVPGVHHWCVKVHVGEDVYRHRVDCSQLVGIKVYVQRHMTQHDDGACDYEILYMDEDFDWCLYEDDFHALLLTSFRRSAKQGASIEPTVVLATKSVALTETCKPVNLERLRRRLMINTFGRMGGGWHRGLNKWHNDCVETSDSCEEGVVRRGHGPGTQMMHGHGQRHQAVVLSRLRRQIRKSMADVPKRVVEIRPMSPTCPRHYIFYLLGCKQHKKLEDEMVMALFKHYLPGLRRHVEVMLLPGTPKRVTDSSVKMLGTLVPQLTTFLSTMASMPDSVKLPNSVLASLLLVLQSGNEAIVGSRDALLAFLRYIEELSDASQKRLVITALWDALKPVWFDLLLIGRELTLSPERQADLLSFVKPENALGKCGLCNEECRGCYIKIQKPDILSVCCHCYNKLDEATGTTEAVVSMAQPPSWMPRFFDPQARRKS